MMTLNHINIPVSDVDANRDFFTKYFGMVTVMELKNNMLAMLVDKSGLALNLSHFDDDKAAPIVHHKDLHIGFFVETPREVDEAFARMTAAGLAAPAPRKMEGRYAFYVKAPGGFDVEVACLQQSLQQRVGHDGAQS